MADVEILNPIDARTTLSMMDNINVTGPSSSAGGSAFVDADVDNNSNTNAAEPEGNNKRSERKRQREKQRRSDLSNAFDELAAFIAHVEPESAEDESDKKTKRRKSTDGTGEESSGITRLELIGRAVRIMKRLHRENEERKRIIATMDVRQPNDNVSTLIELLY
jgi:hypothetical protein